MTERDSFNDFIPLPILKMEKSDKIEDSQN